MGRGGGPDPPVVILILYARGATPALTTCSRTPLSVTGLHHPSANNYRHKVGATGQHGKAAPPPTGQPHPLLYATPLPGVSRPTTGSDEPHPASFCCALAQVPQQPVHSRPSRSTSTRVHPSTRDATVPGGDPFLIEYDDREEDCTRPAGIGPTMVILSPPAYPGEAGYGEGSLTRKNGRA